MDLPRDQFLEEHVQVSLMEDIGEGDVTTDNIIGPGEEGRARVIAKENGILAGRRLFDLTFDGISNIKRNRPDGPDVEWNVEDTDRVKTGDVVAEVEGALDLLLTGERVALNYLQQLSGIASMTARFVSIAQPHGVDVYDTRKTVPHMRRLHKYAVRCGGGKNHRLSLSESVMIKDNHKAEAGGLGAALAKIDRDVPVVVEIHDPEELSDIGDFDIDVIMLDNFEPNEINDVLGRVPSNVALEVSGGITIDNLESYCETGIDRVSVGRLTHSYDSLDFSVELIANG